MVYKGYDGDKRNRRFEKRMNNEEIEQVKEFLYLGGVISEDGECEQNLKRRVVLAYASFNKLTNIWKAGKLSKVIKIRVLDSMVVLILLYESKCLTLRKRGKQRIL